MASDSTKLASTQNHEAALSILNPSPKRLPGPALLHQLVSTAPVGDAPAIHHLTSTHSTSEVSFSELHRRAEAIASQILNVLPDQSPVDQLIVPVLLPQGPDLYIALLAILKAGGAFCPLNLDAPHERVKFILADVSAQIVLTSQDLSPKISAVDGTISILAVDSPENVSTPGSSAVQDGQRHDPDDSDLAYVMYTSGSTGTPKGVGISHHAATQSLLAHDEHIPPFSRFLQFAAPTFDVSVFEIFFPLFRGATLVSADRRLMLDDLPAVLREMEVDACELTPTVAGSLLRKRENAPGLKLLLTIGEMLTGPVVQEFGGGGDDERKSILWAMYGPTEATIHCTLQPAVRANATVNSIGFPLSTVSAYIIPIATEAADGEVPKEDSANLTVLPIGEVGELAIGGHQLTRGYINRPEQTAAAFIESSVYGRLYRTGDKARLRPDGVLECLGRISEGQIKLRGQRLELGEVEAAVLRVDGCHGAVATVVGGTILVVFCSFDLPGTAGWNSLQKRVLAACSAWLPQFMVPNEVVILEDFLRLPSGKVDRKGLVAQYEAARIRSHQQKSQAQYRDSLERDLCDMASRALEADIGPSSSLASAGLDSLSAIRLASVIRKSGLEVSAVDVLASRTISQLAKRMRKPEAQRPEDLKGELRDMNTDFEVEEAIPQVPRFLKSMADEIQSIMPCTPLQQSMISETMQNTQAYRNWIELEFHPSFTQEQASLAVHELIRRNDIFRTTFVHLSTGGFVQVVWRCLYIISPRLSALDTDDIIRPLQLDFTHQDTGVHMVMKIHHALYDGWSIDIFLQDLESLLAGQLPPQRTQFRSVVQYYQSEASRSAADGARTFWAQNLLNFQPAPFPLLVVTPQQRETKSDTFKLDFRPDDVKALATNLGCSSQVVFQACLMCLWSSLVGVDDVVIGTVTSGRTLPIPGVEDIMGPCLAPVPLRAKLSEVHSLRELFGYLHAANRALLPHTILPLGEIRKIAGLLPSQPLYDVLFVYQESLFSKRTVDNGAKVRQAAHQDYLETKLLVEVEPSVSDFTLRITYQTDSVPRDFIPVMVAYFESVLGRVLETQTLSVASLRGGFPETILSRHNTKPYKFQGCTDLACMVEQTASESPVSLAVCFADSIPTEGLVIGQTITYHGLNALANRIAHFLLTAGAKTGMPVAIVMEKSILLYAGILGILKAGCAYIPLLPTTPLGRIDIIFDQANVELCIVDSPALHALSALTSVCQLLDISIADLDGLSTENLNLAQDPNRVANIIYTSGTTGVPKGVCVTQLNVASNLDVLSKIYPQSCGSHNPGRFLQSCSQAFDVSVFEIFYAWKMGMCLCSGSNDTLFADLEHAIRALNVTHLSMTPTVAALIDPKNVPQVEFLVTSGEPMTRAVAAKWTGLLYQGYGPSETTNICTVRKMRHGDAIQHLGHGFENTSSFVVQRNGGANLELVPYGCLGELCFGGDQVVQGYLGIPDLTAEKFIDHPQYGRVYRSGDLGRMLPDGSLVISGRVDDQIKLRGQRVELKEIDAVMRGCEHVIAAVTLVVTHGESDADQLAAFYVPSCRSEKLSSSTFHVLSGEDVPASEDRMELSQLIKSTLPGYMVPSYIIPVSVIPMTPSGKVDKTRLRDSLAQLSQETLQALVSAVVPAAEGDEDWSEAERDIAHILAEIVHVDWKSIRRWTPFASLGLDSISAIAVARRLRDVAGVPVPVSQVLRCACVARLGQFLFTLMPTSHPSYSLQDEILQRPQFFDEAFVQATTDRFTETQIEAVLPCTPLQEAMLASSRGPSASYLNQMVFKLRVDGVLMRSFWTEMCKRHAILRTCFITTELANHAIVQVVLKAWVPTWEAFDPANDQSSLENSLQSHAAGLPPALDTLVPPVSFALAHHNGTDFLIFACHHALYDGVAVSQLLREVEMLVSGRRNELLPAPSYALFLREVFRLPASTDAFWTEQLSEFHPKVLPVAANNAKRPVAVWQPPELCLSDTNNRLKDLGISLLAVCQASWAIALSILLDETDVCFGNVVSGRSIPIERIEELVAPCFNTIPVRLNTANSRCHIDLGKSLQQANIESLPYQMTPLRRIQSKICSGSDSTRLFDTMVLLQQPPQPLDPSIWTLERDDGTMDVPLVCEVIPHKEIDLLQVKIHRDESSVSSSLAALVHLVFSHAFATVLKSPYAPTLTRATLPKALSQQLEALGLEYPTRIQTPQAGIHPLMSLADERAWSPIETAIRTILSGLSSTEESSISLNTTIYQLGLDSISAVQIASSLRRQSFSVSAMDVMENTTCSRLAAFIESNNAIPSAELISYDLESFQRHCEDLIREDKYSYAVDAILPCTPLQHAMLTEFINSDGSNYLNFIKLRLVSTTNFTKIKEAWLRATETHEMLRMGFVAVEHKDASFAMIRYSTPFELVAHVPREEADTFDMEDWHQVLRHIILENLEQPPWRCLVVEKSTGELDIHLAIHHALYDAQSLQAILDDFSILATGGGEIHTPQIGVASTVSDIMGQAAAGLSEAKKFWLDKASRVVINRFPTMTPLRVEQRRVEVTSHVSPVSLAQLEYAVKGAGVSFQALIQAAWTRLLCSYLGESSVVFGIVLSGRNSDATKSAIFPCITTLPVDVTNDRSNKGLLQQMMAYNAGLHRGQHVPLTQIQNWLGLPDTRLFDTLVVFQKMDVGSGGPKRQLWEVVDDKATVDYPVSLEVEPRYGHLHYQLTFYNDILPQEQGQLLLQQFDAVLRHLALSPEGDEDELWNSSHSLFSITPAAEPELPTKVRFLHQFVEDMAVQCPGKTALEFVSGFDGVEPISRVWTYQELDQNGNRIANILEPHTEVGGIVAVLFDKCPEAYFSILGVLKAGCSFVALDPGAPPARKQFILEDSGASVLLTDTQRATYIDFSLPVPVIGVDEELIMASSAEQLVAGYRQLTPNDRCYCLYTSGTTGTPKGCEITHENAVQAMLAFQDLFAGHWEESSKWLQFASLHFDVSVLEQYWSWAVGITLVAAPKDLILEDLLATISRLQITHIDLTPSLARLVHPDEVPSLCRGVFITGGEQLKQEILDVWGDPGVIYNAYGPTEATIGVTMYQRVPRTGRASNIGKQFLNVGSYIFKPGTEIPVLRGGVGELCVSGKLVGKGYLNREELTVERFPTLKDFGERVYRTGDLVRILHDGCFDFLGRADDQVKLRGQRLEIGEINHAIRAGVPEIQDVATMVIRDEKKQKDFLVSFVVEKHVDTLATSSVDLLPISSEHGARLVQDVQDACRAKLPGYMVPTYIVQLPFIPLSSNNKAEVKELRTLFGKLTPDQLLAASAASSRTESSLHGHIAQKVIGVLRTMQILETDQPPTAATSIFELGIDSISVLRFSRALKRGGLSQATPALILKYPVLGDLVRRLQTEAATQDSGAVLEARQSVEACRHRHRAQACRALGISSEQIEYIAPCSALQLGMISRSKTDEHRGSYFNVFAYKLHHDVDVSRLVACWQVIVDSFSILRTKFLGSTEGFVQVALREMALPWTQLEVGEDGEASQEALQEAYQNWIEKNSKDMILPFQLLLVAAPDGTRTLRLHIFHGLYDANSFGMIIAKVAALYLGTEAIESRTTFIDALIHGPLRNFNHTRTFWERHLEGAKFNALPCLSNTPSDKSVTVARSLKFSNLEPARRRLNATHSALVQALWLSVLRSRYRIPLTVGVIVFGRAIDVENAEHVVGPLFNTLPFHVSDVQDETWGSLVQRCHDFNTTTLPFQHVPLRDIQKWCSGGQPLFDTLFSCQREPLPSAAVTAGLWDEVSAVDPAGNTDYPLAFEATLTRDDKLELLLVVEGGIADGVVLNAMLDEFENAMTTMAADSEARILDFSGDLAPGDPASTPTPRQKLPSTYDEPLTRSAFKWTKEALLIRSEVASLAGISPDMLDENKGLLELGLDSIDTIKLSARLKTQGVNLTNGQLVKGQTVSRYMDMLTHVSDADKRNSAVNAEEDLNARKRVQISQALIQHLGEETALLDLSTVESILPPTPLQDAMVADMLQSRMRRYFNHDVLELSDNTDMGQVRRAWQQVVDSSPILRTVFLQIDSAKFDFAFCQVVLKEMTLNWEEMTVENEAGIHQVIESVRERAEQEYGMAGLFCLSPIRLGDRKLLVLSIAHALYDGWSLDLLHKDVQDSYHGRFSPRQRYDEYLDHILLSASDEAREFWIDSLTGASATNIQPQKLQLGVKKRPNNDEAPVAAVETVHRAESTSSTTAADLIAFCKRRAVSPQVVGQVCWAAVLSRRVQSLDVTFGSVLSGRETEAAEDLLFPTMNTVAIRAVLHGTIGSLLRYVQETMAGVTQFQHYPLRKAKRLSAGSAADSLFNTLFIMQKRRGLPVEDQNPPIMRSVDGNSSVEYPVCVEMEIVDSSIVWRTACSDYFLSRQETHHLLRELDEVLKFLTQSPADLSIFSLQSRAGVTGSEISVCGLPSFHLQTPTSLSSSTVISSQTDVSTLVDEDDEDWSPVEKKIKSVLVAVSGDPSLETSVRKTHNLYNFGLDSISAIKVASLLRKEGIALRVKDLLKAESVTDMANLAISQNTIQSPGASLDNTVSPSTAGDDRKGIDAIISSLLKQISSEDVEQLIPASSMQTHMLSVWQNTSGDVFFPEFNYRLADAHERLVLDDIRTCWTDLVHEMPILRTAFMATGSAAVPFLQAVLQPHEAYFNRTFIEGGRPAEKEASETDSRLFSRPMVKLYVEEYARGSGSGWSLTLKIHHALYDGFSLPKLMDRFGEILDNFVDSRKPNILGVNGKDWASRVKGSFSQESRDKRKTFWTKYLDGARSQPFHPLNDSSSTIRKRASKFTVGTFDSLAALRKRCASAGVSFQALFIAAAARMLAKGGSDANNTTDVVLGLYLANRDGDDDRLGALAYYPTLSLVPLRVVCRPGDDLFAAASTVQRDLLKISDPANAAVGLWEINEWTGIQVDCFVNFLSLPSSDEQPATTKRVALEQLTTDWTETDRQVVEAQNPHPDEYHWLRNNAVQDAFTDAVDIEASISPAGTLDIGVFSPGEKLGGDEGAEMVISTLVEILKGE